MFFSEGQLCAPQQNSFWIIWWQKIKVWWLNKDPAFFDVICDGYYMIVFHFSKSTFPGNTNKNCYPLQTFLNVNLVFEACFCDEYNLCFWIIQVYLQRRRKRYSLKRYINFQQRNNLLWSRTKECFVFFEPRYLLFSFNFTKRKLVFIYWKDIHDYEYNVNLNLLLL